MLLRLELVSKTLQASNSLVSMLSASLSNSSRCNTYTRANTQSLRSRFDTNSNNSPSATAARERYCVLTGPDDHELVEFVRSGPGSHAIYALRVRTSVRGRKLRSERTIGKSGAFCDHSCDSCLKTGKTH